MPGKGPCQKGFEARPWDVPVGCMFKGSYTVWQHSVLRRVLSRFWEGFWGRVLRRVVRRGFEGF